MLPVQKFVWRAAKVAALSLVALMASLGVLAAQTTVAEPPLSEQRSACAMPKASDAAKVVLIGSHGPEALSSVTIGSQDVAVSAGTINVERGAEPIYLVVVSFEPTIWRVAGDVGRIERLVLTAGAPPPEGMPRNKSLVGATGVAADKITFLPPRGCFSSFTVAPSTAAAIAAGAVKRDAGKEVTTVAAAQSFAEVAVPSGDIHSLHGKDVNKLTVIQQAGGSLKIVGNPRNIVVRSGPTSAAEALKTYRPGGVMQIDPSRVVATMPAERYAVLPEEAGLVQLVKAGDIAQNRPGEYLIKRKIRFPAGLYGGHLVKFLLLRGVPTPDGDPGHSDVISEETGREIDLDGTSR